MNVESLTYEAVRLRAVLVPLKRKVVSRVGHFDRWPLILIDLQTKEGIVGTSYLEPYLHTSPRYIMPAISDLVEARKGQPLAPMADFQAGRKSLNLIGYEGVAMIANAGIDMAAWDALAKAADVPAGRPAGRHGGKRARLQQQRPVADRPPAVSMTKPRSWPPRADSMRSS